MKKKELRFNIPLDFSDEQRTLAKKAINSYLDLIMGAIKGKPGNIRTDLSVNDETDTYTLIWDDTTKFSMPPSNVVASMQVEMFDKVPDRYDIVNPVVRSIELFEINKNGYRRVKPMTKNGYMFMDLMEKRGEAFKVKKDETTEKTSK
jgi:hypothetical protein